MRTILRWCSLGLCIAFGGAHALAAQLVVEPGILTGANGVRVGGGLYNVEFVDGTCVALFAGCDSATDFTFTPSALDAAGALLDQVFIDDPQLGAFDSTPALTAGCANPVCYVVTPSDPAPHVLPYPAVSTGVARNSSASLAGTAEDDDVQGTYYPIDLDCSTGSQCVYARWTFVSQVPEPGTVACLGLGVLVMVLVQRRRTLSRGRTQSLSQPCSAPMRPADHVLL